MKKNKIFERSLERNLVIKEQNLYDIEKAYQLGLME